MKVNAAEWVIKINMKKAYLLALLAGLTAAVQEKRMASRDD